MSRVRQRACASIVALVGMLVAVSADAQSVTKNGTTIFDAGGFESDVVGAQPGAPPAGSWLQIQPGNVARISVYGPASGGPGAKFGNNYLHAFRPDSSSDAFLRAGFTQPIAIGDLLHLSTWVWLDNVPQDYDFFTGFESEDLSTRVWMAASSVSNGSGGYRLLINQGGAGADLADIAYTPQKWQEWTMDWIVGSNQVTIGIDGATQIRPLNAGTFATPISELRFAASNFPSTFYLDGPEVPEPSTLVLMGLGLIGAGAWRLRRGKM